MYVYIYNIVYRSKREPNVVLVLTWKQPPSSSVIFSCPGSQCCQQSEAVNQVELTQETGLKPLMDMRRYFMKWIWDDMGISLNRGTPSHHPF